MICFGQGGLRSLGGSSSSLFIDNYVQLVAAVGSSKALVALDSKAYYMNSYHVCVCFHLERYINRRASS